MYDLCRLFYVLSTTKRFDTVPQMLPFLHSGSLAFSNFDQLLLLHAYCYSHFVFIGPEGTPYEGGFFHGMLCCCPEYPFKPPSIFMITPTGRFSYDVRLCFTTRAYHPEEWNPAWTVGSILTALLSFMVTSY